MVGSANGRSITASTNRLPGKSSRVSTQATRSPKTPLMMVTPIEMLRVTFNESNAALEVTASQKACQPPLADCHTIAANGSSTIRLSQIEAAPTRTAVVPRRRAGEPDRRPGSPSPVTRAA